MSEDLTQPHAYKYVESRATDSTDHTPPPDDHTLNACLARVIGKQIWPHPNRKISSMLDWACSKGPWEPLRDANQMEEVEAWLRENKWTYRVVWYGHMHEARIGADWDDTRFVKYDKDKKRAFALAVQAMEQSQKETT